MLRATALCVAVGLLHGCATRAADVIEGPGVPAAAAAAPTAPVSQEPPVGLAAHRVEVEALLASLSTAFLAGDAALLETLLHDPSSAFGTRWLARVGDMAQVPFTSYSLTLDTTLADVTSAAVPGDGGLLVNVLEDHQLEGMDALGVLREHLFLTLRQRDGRWTVAGDADGEALGLVSADHLWDHGPVVTSRAGAVLLLHHPGQRGVDTLMAETTAALATASERWPLAWPRTVPVLVPRDQQELGELLHVTFDLSNFIAFATAVPVGELGEVELSGSRVMLNTDRFLDRSSATRERIMVHELIHAASRPSSGPHQPSWLEEGVAQVLGERRSTTGTVLLDALSDSDWTGSLPLDAEFNVGGRDRIFLSYQQAWSFVDWLASEHGEDQVGAFYEAAGRGGVGRPGTVAALMDQATMEVFGASLDALVAAWRASL